MKNILTYLTYDFLNIIKMSDKYYKRYVSDDRNY